MRWCCICGKQFSQRSPELLHVSRNGGKNYMCRECTRIFAMLSDESLSLEEAMPAVVYIAENLDNITDLEVKKIVEDTANDALRNRPDV